MYVYRVFNKKNGKMYIGSTNNYLARKNEHFGSLRKGTHHNAFLQREFIEFGESCFVFEVLFNDIKDRTNALLKEYDLILRNKGKCYNIHTECPVFDPRKKQDWKIYKSKFVPPANNKPKAKKKREAAMRRLIEDAARGVSKIVVDIPPFRRKK